MMKILIATIFILSLSIQGFGQKRIVITQMPQQVPEGKKWLLKDNMSTIIEVNEGALISGSLCNAQMLSNPGLLNFINEGEYTRPNKLYQIEFNRITKVSFTNNLTYKISSISSFRCQNFPSINYSRQNEIVFYPGDKVSVNGCLQSLLLLETVFTDKEELAFRQKLKVQKNLADKQANQQRLKDFENNFKKTGGYPVFNALEKVSMELYNLPNRTFITPPKIIDTIGHNGVVAINIRIDKTGWINYVRAGANGTTIKDVDFIQSIENSFFNSRFNNIDTTSEFQTGYIRLSFTQNLNKQRPKRDEVLPAPLDGLKKKRIITKLSKAQIFTYYKTFHETNIGENYFYLPALKDGNDSCILVEIEKQGGLNVLKFSKQCD
jgi:hypothetical protein